jgi:hypothetical protein
MRIDLKPVTGERQQGEQDGKKAGAQKTHGRDDGGLSKGVKLPKEVPRRHHELLGRTGFLWQRDYFDRLVRNEPHLASCVRDIRRNPENARPREGEYALDESDIARGSE